MASEPKRGCGYRKVGGKYLVGGGVAVACDRLPLELSVCPCCHAGIKQSRGWTWVNVAMLVGGIHPNCLDDFPCPLCMETSKMGNAGLLWIGEKFYPTPQDFDREGAQMGFSRRISAIPRDFKVGETWVLLAHRKTFKTIEPDENGVLRDTFKPGIFKVWRPTRIEQLCKESDRNSEMVAELIKRGITPVFVPDDDKDHQGSVHDKQEEKELISE
jgi:hypothetical protein